jgi:hypothetical protein
MEVMKLSEVWSLCIRWTQPRRRSFASGRAFREVSVLRALLENEIRKSSKAQAGHASTGKADVESGADHTPKMAAAAQSPGTSSHESAEGAHSPESRVNRSFNPQQWILKAAEKLKTVNPALELEDMHIDLTLAEGKYLLSEDEQLAQIAARTIFARCLLTADSEDKFSAFKERYGIALQEADELGELIKQYQSIKGSEFIEQAAYLRNRLLESLNEGRLSD